MTDQETTGTGAVQQPVTMYAEGPSGVAEPGTERQTFKNNAEAFDAKQAESMAAQMAPNPTTDADLAREAYGEDWNRRRGHVLIATTEAGDKLFDHGGSVVDSVGHVLGHTANVDDAVARKQGLGTDGELGRYPVTAEAQADELRKANDSGASADESKTLDGGLGVAVDGGAQNEHDRQVADSGAESYSAPTDGKLSTDDADSEPVGVKAGKSTQAKSAKK
jgi:hypothetical protein